MTDVRAVLLDVGGVFHLPGHEHVCAALARLGIVADVETCDRAHYAGVAALTRFDENDLDVWRMYHRTYVGTLGATKEQVAEATELLLDAFVVDEVWTRVVPGSREALAVLADHGFALAIVSNANGTVEQRLREYGICQVGPGPGVPVGAVVDSSVVGFAKPDPRIFEVALARLGVSARHAVHVGDTPGADVDGARAAGVRPMLIDPYDDHADLDVERVRSLADLVRVLTS